MYTIYNDGQLLYSTAGTDDAHILLNPKLSLDVNGAGALTFTIPPGHAQYDAIRKLKGIITVEQDGTTIFRGRAMDDEKDFYNQKDVYCEGDRAFLLDSQCAPYEYTGTARGLLQKLLSEHNSQVEADKRFALGSVTAVSASETLNVENTAYWETWKEIDEKLLAVYGGYMMTRTEGGTTYLDWLAVSGKTNTQPIQFSVNLLDLRDKVDAADVFTVLIPLGASVMGDDGEYSDPVSIASVNGGLPYIQDDDAVALYGKIWKSKTWNDVNDPAELLQKARKYMKTGIATQTLTLSAIDMHFVDESAEALRVGDHVRILSNPHGLDMTIICAKMDIDLQNPESTSYTFGEAPRALTDNVVQTKDAVSGMTGGGGRSVKEELGDVIRWAEIKIDEKEAAIDLLTGEVSKQGERLSKAEISLDGVNAQIVLKADLETTDELARRVNAAEIEIDGANAQIVLKANSTTVDALGNRVSAAEVEIDGLNSEITLKADKVTIDAELTSIKKYFAGSATVAKMIVTNLTAMSMTFDGMKCAWANVEIPTAVRIPALSGYNVTLGDGSTTVIYAFSGNSRACTLTKDSMSLMKAST